MAGCGVNEEGCDLIVLVPASHKCNFNVIAVNERTNERGKGRKIEWSISIGKTKNERKRRECHIRASSYLLCDDGFNNSTQYGLASYASIGVCLAMLV